MKISVTKKLLIICLSLILALTTALFAAQIFSRSTYAQVSPDGLSAYADGDDEDENESETDTPKIPGGGAIATPEKPDDNDVDKDNWLFIQQITLEVGKLNIRVDAWNEGGLSTKANLNANPDGIYDARPDLVAKIKELISTPDFIQYTIKDVNGNVLSQEDLSNLGEGVTVFVHVGVQEEYANSVNITFKEGVTESYAYTTDFASGTKLTEVDKITDTYFELDFLGEAINLQDILDKVLKDRDTYLMFVASESDALIQNGAGEFQLKIAFRDGAKYCWKNTGIPNDRSPVTITVKIKPKVLEAVTDFDELGEWYYTGYEIDVADILKELYGDLIVVSAGYSTKETEAGSHSFNIMINPLYSDSVVWEEGVEDPVTINWTIKPSVITGEWKEPQSEYGRITITSDTYPGIQSGDIEYIYTENGEVVTDLVINHTYTVEVVLKNPNLVWSEDPGPHTFELTKELITLPKPEISMTETEYTGSPITFTVTIDGVPLSEYADKVEIVEELSDALTQTNVGKYKVVIRIIDDAVSWPGYDTGDVVLNFEITKIEIDVQWNDADAGMPTYKSSLESGDYSNVVKLTYYNAQGIEVKKSQMVKGETYVAVVTLIDENNFEWKDGAVLSYTFVLNVDFITLDQPQLSGDTFDYTGNLITISVTNQAQLEEYIKAGYIEVVSGQFEQTNAGTYTVVLKITNSSCIWSDSEDDYLTLTYTINKAVLTGEWQSNGKVNFTSSFEGNYDDVVEYVYVDGNGNEFTSLSQLTEGVEYTVTVRLKEGMEQNFDDSQLPAPYTFTYKASSDGSSFPWWIFLIIGLLLLLIIIIIIIIIIIKRRKKDDDYDDYYDDEYYGDEDMNGNGSGEDGGYDDYGSGDYGSDDYGTDGGY